MHIIIGIIIGLAAGAAQYLLLSRFTRRVTAGPESGSGFVLFGLLQWVLPFAVLLLVGLLYTPALLPAGITIATTLIVGAVARIIIGGRKK
ncbi:MAG: hypothetical protein LBN00_07700 [Oscillospiraceae bacterium]|jgi:hypothetical protein|nr:hypothetical protein [Oscillospiraceae bacterium]